MKENKREYQVWDTCSGIVEGKCGSGIYLMLDNGQSAFAYQHTGLKTGKKVLCSVKRQADGKRRMLVTIDSTLQYDAA